MARHFDPVSAFIPSSNSYERGKFGRLFPWLTPCLEDTPQVREDLYKLAKIMQESPRSNEGTMPAGYTYLGQFIAHDMSFDPTSINERQVDPEFLWNFRTPALDLDSVYGGGPKAMPYLYDPSSLKNYGSTHFLLGKDNPVKPEFFDLPRLDSQEKKMAVIADPRNDEHLIISQLHVAFLLLHNKIADELSKTITNIDEVFRIARQEVQWRYQWVLIYDYLPKILDLSVFDEEFKQSSLSKGAKKNLGTGEKMNWLVKKKDSRKYYDWRNEPFIPLEFSVAAFRFGHSQVLNTYKFNEHVRGELFPKTKEDAGFNSTKTAFTFIDWSSFFPEFKESTTIKSAQISPSLANTMSHLPNSNININENSLAARNLIKGLMLKLPSGQSVARAMGLPEKKMLNIVKGIPDRFKEHTPLWYYILKEAHHFNDGIKLGPVGSRIVAEVVIGILQADKLSFLTQFPNWVPEKIANNPLETYTMADLLKEAGVYNGALV
jgi:Animal haem peroxidase